jgi:hypothetical protein
LSYSPEIPLILWVDKVQNLAVAHESISFGFGIKYRSNTLNSLIFAPLAIPTIKLISRTEANTVNMMENK